MGKASTRPHYKHLWISYKRELQISQCMHFVVWYSVWSAIYSSVYYALRDVAHELQWTVYSAQHILKWSWDLSILQSIAQILQYFCIYVLKCFCITMLLYFNIFVLQCFCIAVHCSNTCNRPLSTSDTAARGNHQNPNFFPSYNSQLMQNQNTNNKSTNQNETQINIQMQIQLKIKRLREETTKTQTFPQLQQS